MESACPPREPMELSLIGIYSEAPKINKIVEQLSSHILGCSSFHLDLRMGGAVRSCDNSICSYFRWFYPYHYNQCSYTCFRSSTSESGCGYCRKLKLWLTQHSASCSESCPIVPCQNVYKTEILKNRFKDINQEKPLYMKEWSVTSSVTITSSQGQWRSHPPTGEFAESAEYNLSMQKNYSPQEFSSSFHQTSLKLPKGETILDYLAKEDELSKVHPEESLSLPRPPTAGDNEIPMAIQRQFTEEDKKAIYGQNSITLSRTIAEPESRDFPQESCDIPRRRSRDLARGSRDVGSRSPRRSEELTKQRKLQLSKDKNICESPEVQRSNTRTNTSEYSSLEGDSRPHSCFHGSNLTSSDYDSTGPNSLEEDEQVTTATKGRQARVFQREDSDFEGEHTKMILGTNGSITTAHYQHIRALNSSNLSKLCPEQLRPPRDCDHSNRNSGTSGVCSGPPSNSSLTFSERDDAYSSLEDPSVLDSHETYEDGYQSNYETGHYETEGSVTSTIIGTSSSISENHHQQHAPQSSDMSPDMSQPSQPMSFMPPMSHDHYRYESSSPDSDQYYSYRKHSESSSSCSEELPFIDPHCFASTPSQPFFSLQQNLEAVDSVFEQYKYDIHVMNNRPRRGGGIPTHTTPTETQNQTLEITELSVMDPECDFDPGLPSRSDPELVAKQHELHRQMVLEKFPEDREVIRRGIMARRDQLKQYLIGRFYSDQVYREHANWRRRTRLGGGAQAACYSVTDNNTQCILVLKEENETKKSLDEAYLSLKFACQSNPSPNIVEYYTAALLPSNMLLPPGHTPFVQIFMEQMPTSLQEWLFRFGPIALHNVHHYACQLFDALDFLHNGEGVIHCDIKPANILIDDTAQRIKLTDFGSAEVLEGKSHDERKLFSADRNAGTLNYNPPEFYRHNQCGFGFDVWQAGCCVLAMATGRRPWRHLYMDVYREPQTPPQVVSAMKRLNIERIKQQYNGHVLPTFLDHTLRKLLYGCLHDNPALRLTAKECNYLLNIETASSEEERITIHSAISNGYSTPMPSVLKTLQTEESEVDVYLGSSKICHLPLSDHMTPGEAHMTCRMALKDGWVGSISTSLGMTYREAEMKIRDSFPVVQQLGTLILHRYGNSPQAVWTACNSKPGTFPPYTQISLDAHIDTNSALILVPATFV